MKKQKNNLPKYVKLLQIYDVIACIAILGLFGSNMLMSWGLEEGESLPYFNQHFLTPIGFILMGTVAFTLPYINQTATGDPNGDKMMKVVAGIFLVLAFVTMMFSFIG